MSKYVKISELAELLGVSVHTVRQWVRNGKIPRHTYYKVGKTYRFDFEMIETGFRTDHWGDQHTTTDQQDDQEPEQLPLWVENGEDGSAAAFGLSVDLGEDAETFDEDNYR